MSRKQRHARLEALRASFDSKNIDGLLILGFENVLYLSGFAGEGALVLTPDQAVLVTDFRYVEQAQDQAPGFQVEKSTDSLDQAICSVVLRSEPGPRRLGFEADIMTVKRHAELVSGLGPGGELVESPGLVEALRATKDEAEIEACARAAAVSDAVFEKVLPLLVPGAMERDIAAEIEYQGKKLGAQKPAFETIVASGPRGALPHGIASSKTIAAGDMVVLDYGFVVDGYCSDMTRTVAVGGPSDEARGVYGTVKRAQQAGLEGLAPGKTGREVDACARSIIQAAGLADRFGHGLGHSVGLAVHEDPRLSPRGDRVIEERMVVTVEPGVYIPGKFGVRIEDLVVVRSQGPQILSGTTKELICV